MSKDFIVKRLTVMNEDIILLEAAAVEVCFPWARQCID